MNIKGLSIKKFFYIFLILKINLFVGLYSGPVLKLEAEGLELQGNKKIAYLNEPFTFKVIIEDKNKRINQEVEVTGLNNFKILERSQSVTTQMINSAFTAQTSYNYSLLPLGEGEYEIGTNSSPEKLNIKVIKKDPKRVKAEQESHAGEQEVFCKLSSDKNVAVVGEPIVFKLSVYYRGNIARLGFTDMPKFIDLIVKEIKEEKKREEVINNKLYFVLEKDYILFPTKDGKINIDPIRVEAQIPVKVRQNNPFGDDDFFNAFFGSRLQQKFFVSNNLEIKVNPLPVLNTLNNSVNNINGIGKYNSFKISVDKTEAKVGEPIILKLEVSGKGNFDQMVTPKLKLPVSIKFYDSKTDFIPDPNDIYLSGKKVYEYILQVNKPGKIEIPEQDFFYFDVISRNYKNLKSEPISLNIEKNDQLNSQIYKQEELEDKSIKQENKENLKDNLENNLENNNNKITWTFSWYWFLFLILFPLFFYIIFLIKKIKINKSETEASFKKNFNKIIKKNKINDLYKFYAEYLTYKFGFINKELNQDFQNFIEQKLLEVGWTDDKISDFLNYLAECAAISFSKNYKSVNSDILLDKAKYWFFILQSINYKKE